MFLETTATRERVSIRPAGFLGLSEIPELLDHMLRALDSTGRLEFDLSEVSGIDMAGIQFLMLLRKEGVNLGKEVSFARPSPDVREVLDAVGQSSFLDESVGVVR